MFGGGGVGYRPPVLPPREPSPYIKFCIEAHVKFQPPITKLNNHGKCHPSAPKQHEPIESISPPPLRRVISD